MRARPTSRPDRITDKLSKEKREQRKTETVQPSLRREGYNFRDLLIEKEKVRGRTQKRPKKMRKNAKNLRKGEAVTLSLLEGKKKNETRLRVRGRIALSWGKVARRPKVSLRKTTPAIKRDELEVIYVEILWTGDDLRATQVAVKTTKKPPYTISKPLEKLKKPCTRLRNWREKDSYHYG